MKLKQAQCFVQTNWKWNCWIFTALQTHNWVSKILWKEMEPYYIAFEVEILSTISKRQTHNTIMQPTQLACAALCIITKAKNVHRLCEWIFNNINFEKKGLGKFRAGENDIILKKCFSKYTRSCYVYELIEDALIFVADLKARFVFVLRGTDNYVKFSAE